MDRIPRILMIALIVISVIVFVMAVGVSEDDPSSYGNADPLLYVGYIYFGLSTLVALLGALVGVIQKPQNAKDILIGVGGLLLVVIIAYSLSTGSDYAQYDDTTEGWSHFSGTLLYTFYLLAIGAIGSIIFSGVYRLIR
ncbi:hypothetical protein [Salibacter sp.]|jgi:ABC-type cobalt transport system substrate-binding protein|uniref:hypothetical protein n=1 Tax=Salibacter sp. TaxID=2010995 RepID=UPI0028704669|nr:hypothetical protein [Salibacter sp.]MDR9399185.1 hypothetical protein [Salibacter sp.]MDR9487961.1 hypothetical protein [Salibacter sp.]